mgnify:CR=1 FL=1
MRSIIVIFGQRFIPLILAFSLLNPIPGYSNTTPYANLEGGFQSPLTDQENKSLPTAIPTSASQDNDVDWPGLAHDSRDTLYRTPAGSVATGTYVTLRLRASSGDLTAAMVRIFNDRQNTLSLLDMDSVADDGTYEWWQVVLPAPALPTVFWYRFIAIDGSDIDYYADDTELLGGSGAPSDEEVDNSWQLTFYDPAFQTPDWVKNSIIYQISPDRFRDGNLSNNILPDPYYGEDTAIFRSGTSNWNEKVCDPLGIGLCSGVYGENFYGGDLQGVINQLPYLQNLGVTAINFSPIFRSPSYSGYDTNNYQIIDAGMGDNTTLTSLVSLAEARGISVILDGAFNFTSSDSVYFDLYSQYGGVGACESTPTTVSYYRNWFFFYDVAPGTGVCTRTDGLEDSANYIAWNGIGMLPFLNSSNERVQEQFWKESQTVPIAPNWLATSGADGWRLDSGDEIDPGILSNLNNEYWEGFREAIHAVNPNAYIVGETGGNATSWTLGSEWDASTNYLLSNALIGFWRDEPFVDIDHNIDSDIGPIEPLLPSQLNERLLDMQERYAPEALAAMMNLLDSDKTNRALFMLDHNTDLNTSSIYWNPSYNWNDSLTRLRGAVLLQMTLPGAPTIYYGDEVGLVGPITFDAEAGTWQDDPYNRQPYPWLDQTGTPYYTHLQSSPSQNNLLSYYKLLTSTRNAHPALRTGTFDPLLVDDPNLVYAYGRRSFEAADAAIIILNRSPLSQSVSLDLSGYLPATSTLEDVLHNDTQYSISTDGSLVIPNIAAKSGILLIFMGGDLQPPAAPGNLVAIEGKNLVNLSWNAVTGAANYQVFRSLFSNSGYELVATTAATSYTDNDLINGLRYYYVVRAAKLLGMASESSNEVSAIPHWEIEWASLISPEEITHTIGLDPTQPVTGQIYIEDVTITLGPTDRILAQIGFGIAGIQPASWTTWVDAPFDTDIGDYDQFASPIIPEIIGDFQIVFRFSTTNGRDWLYADLDGQFSGIPNHPAILHVLPSGDTTPPSTPGYPTLVDWGDRFATVDWAAIPEDPTLFAYDVYRSTDISQAGQVIARVPFTITEYTDTGVNPATTYYYRIQSVDTSFNRSGLSAQVTAVTVTRQVSVTFRVDVPGYTEGYVYIVGDHPKIGSWDPAKIVMTRVDSDSWTITLTLEEGILLTYKYTRGNYAWLDIETASDGNTDISNRTVLVEGDRGGTMVVNDVVANWRDPLVSAGYPANRATDVPINPVITMTWNQAMEPDTTIALSSLAGPVQGTVSYNPATRTVSFIPAEYLQVNTTYTIDASYQTDIAGDPQLVLYNWTFTTIESITIHTIALPLVKKN